MKKTLLLLVVASCLLAHGAARRAEAQSTAGCPPAAPVLNVPASVRAGESYSVSWTSVLGSRTSSGDHYRLERSLDPGFATLKDKVTTTRPALTLGGLSAALGVVYHRVVVVTACPQANPGILSSATQAVRVISECPSPEGVGLPLVSPETPPAFSTYVVSWDTGSGSVPGPGGAASGLLFRLRRIAGAATKESVSEWGSASFTDPPGEYLYQVRAETRCGSAGPWSPARRVYVGGTPVSSLALTSEPPPMVVVSGIGTVPRVFFTARNTGTTTLEVTSVPAIDQLAVEPVAFRIAPGGYQKVSVTLRSGQPLLAPLHTFVSLAAESAVLRVPIDAMIASAPSEGRVTWSSAEAEIGEDGAVRRTLVNTGSSRAAFVGRISHPWLTVDAQVDEPAWDRPLAPHEARGVRFRVDRGKRRSPHGTEVATVTLTTVGHPDQSDALTVYDDGEASTIATVVRPANTLARTRYLYASMPNALDVHGNGRFTTDLWLSNLDAVSSIEVSLFFTPLGATGALIQSRQVDITLGPGETRRYRNVLARLAGYEGACEVEVRSPATTLSATAIVANTPLSSAARRATLADPQATTPPGGQYGFEMRPTLPGEGVKASDSEFVLSGLAHDTRRRTNILLTETSGLETTVDIKLFTGLLGEQVTKGGEAVQLRVTVPPLGTVQLNDAQLFDAEPLPESSYALITHQPPASGRDGSVVPFATVIDAGTEDASLRVGASTRSLTPLPPDVTPAQPSARVRPDGSSSLPFDGGPAPLLFAAAHVLGAPLSDGTRPQWKTRVTFTNTNRLQGRQFAVRFIDKSGNLPESLPPASFSLTPGAIIEREDFLRLFVPEETPDLPVWGALRIENTRKSDGSWEDTWQDVDVQTETYTPDPRQPEVGDYKTGMEGFSYRHGYSSFQSNLGTVQLEGAENSTRFRTNLILSEVGGASCTVAVAAYWPGSFVPLATATLTLPRFGYVSRELFSDVLGLARTEMTDIRVVVRQMDGDGVFLAFASKINLQTGDPANIFLRPASAGTGR